MTLGERDGGGTTGLLGMMGFAVSDDVLQSMAVQGRGPRSAPLALHQVLELGHHLLQSRAALHPVCLSFSRGTFLSDARWATASRRTMTTGR